MNVLAVVGRSGVGKTTLIEGLLGSFTDLKVATLKHTHHALELERPGSDSARHAAAGARPVVLAGPGFSLVSAELEPLALLALAACNGADLVLAEGFKHGPFPRLEVVRREVSAQPMVERDQLWAVAADCPVDHAHRFPLGDVAAIAQAIRAEMLGPARRGRVSGVDLPIWLETALGILVPHGQHRLDIG